MTHNLGLICDPTHPAKEPRIPWLYEKGGQKYLIASDARILVCLETSVDSLFPPATDKLVKFMEEEEPREYEGSTYHSVSIKWLRAWAGSYHGDLYELHEEEEGGMHFLPTSKHAHTGCVGGVYVQRDLLAKGFLSLPHEGLQGTCTVQSSLKENRIRVTHSEGLWSMVLMGLTGVDLQGYLSERRAQEQGD